MLPCSVAELRFGFKMNLLSFFNNCKEMTDIDDTEQQLLSRAKAIVLTRFIGIHAIEKEIDS